MNDYVAIETKEGDESAAHEIDLVMWCKDCGRKGNHCPTEAFIVPGDAVVVAVTCNECGFSTRVELTIR